MRNKSNTWMPLVEQELLTIPELPFSRLFFVGFVLLNYDVHCLSFLSFFLSHCIVWSFHLQLMIAPSVSLVLPFTAYDCSFSIFGPSIYSLWLLLRYLQTFLMKRKHWDHINCCLNNQYHIINIGYCNAERYKCPPIEQYKYQWYEWRIVWEHSKK